MNKILLLFFALATFACTPSTENKIPVYAWTSGPGDKSNEELLLEFENWKNKGIDGLLYNAGHDKAVYARVAPLAQQAGLEFHSWIPTLLQSKEGLVDTSLYAVNRRGESTWSNPPYVGYYKFLCPNQPEVYTFLEGLYGKVAEVPEVDGIHLDYIRFPDVILARGLWEKYGLVMDKEYPQFDYCYCDKCVSDFEEQSGINILEAEDPSQVEEWKQFRYDLITDLVNHLSEHVHSKGKSISAAVFPGPHSVARRIVRQEWDQWNLDAYYPMNYNDFYLEGVDWIGEVSREAVELTGGKAPVFSGLFICPNPEKKDEMADPENHGLIPSEIPDAVRASVANGAAGICLFTPGRMTPEGWEALQEVIYEGN